MKFTTKYTIIEEIIRREINNKDKKIIYDNMCKYLYNDLTNIEHCSTSLIFASMKEIFPAFNHMYREDNGLIRYDIAYPLAGKELTVAESDEIFSRIKGQLQIELDNLKSQKR